MRSQKSILLFLTLLTVGVFARVSLNDFVNYDDPDYVTANSYVLRGFTWDGIKWAFSNLHGAATYWHPLTWLSHMLDVQLFGLKPAGHHVMNLLFHTANVLLLFVVLNRFTGALWQSAFAAAVFAIHPLQVDTVAWVTERKNVLSGLFWMLTLLAWLNYVSRPTLARYSLMLLTFALGLMCKPVLVTLPCAMLLMDVWPLRRWIRTRKYNLLPSLPPGLANLRERTLGFLVLEKLPLLLLAVGSSLVTVLAHEGLGITQESHGLPFDLRIQNAFVSYARYLGKFIWPSDLAALYPHPGKWPEAAVWGSFLLLALITQAAVWNFRQRPFLLIGWLWFLGVLFPAIGILQIGVQAMADRFIYLPIIGLLIAVSWAGAEVVSRFKFKPALVQAGAAGLLIACATITSMQLRHWKNSFTLWRHTISVTQNNFLAHNNLAYALYEAGELDAAKGHAIEAAQIKSDFGEPRLQLGMIMDKKGQPGQAVPHYRDALAIHPNWPLARRLLADALVNAGKGVEAIAEYQELLRMVPADVSAHLMVADLLSKEGKIADAIQHYREAIRLSPDDPQALNNLAWILATDSAAENRNGKEAVELAQRACAVTNRKVPVLIGTLAAAHAENGDFETAARTAEEAASLARSSGADEVAATNERLKKLYIERKPFRSGN